MGQKKAEEGSKAQGGEEMSGTWKPDPRKKKRSNPGNNDEFEHLFPKSEDVPATVEGSVAKAKIEKGEKFRKAFGLPSHMWKQYITDHLRKAGLKGRSFEDAQKAMIEGAHRWRMARAHGSPIYPLEARVPDGRLHDFEIMRYVGPTEHDYFPHRVMLREGAYVIIVDSRLLNRKEVPVITRGKGYLFLVSKRHLHHVVPKLTQRQLVEAKREWELYLESPEAEAIAKKYNLV